MSPAPPSPPFIGVVWPQRSCKAEESASHLTSGKPSHAPVVTGTCLEFVMTDFPMPWAESEDRESLHLLDRKRMTVRGLQRHFRDAFLGERRGCTRVYTAWRCSFDSSEDIRRTALSEI